MAEPAGRFERNKSTTLNSAEPITTTLGWCWSQRQRNALPTSESLVKIISSCSFFATTSCVRGGMRPLLHVTFMSCQSPSNWMVPRSSIGSFARSKRQPAFFMTDEMDAWTCQENPHTDRQLVQQTLASASIPSPHQAHAKKHTCVARVSVCVKCSQLTAHASTKHHPLRSHAPPTNPRGRWGCRLGTIPKKKKDR